MAEYINRAELISNLKEFANEQLTPLIENLIQKQPTADVAEVRYGKWQPYFEDWRTQIEDYECSVCGFHHYGMLIRNYLYCPNCGAKME